MKGPDPWTLAVGLGAGALVYSAGTWGFGPDIFPPLPVVAARLAEALAQGSTWSDLGLTLGRTALGFLLAVALGLPLGLLLGTKTWADRLGFLPVILLQACPPLFWVIPLILILGTDGQAPTAVVFLVVLPLVTLNVREARRALAPTLADVFRIYAPGRWIGAQELLGPALGPALRSSLVLGSVLGLKSAVLGEWFGSHTGLGRAIYRLYGVFDMGGFFALVFLFLAVGALVGLGSEALGRRLFPARRPTPAPRPGRRGHASRPLEPLAPGGLKVEDLAFRWGNRPLFSGIGLAVAPGEVVVVTGRSGSGKTTLARLALGLLVPAAGKVEGPRRPGVLFQEDGLLAHRTVEGNVLLPAWQRRDRSPEAALRARDLITLVGLGGEEEKYPDELSGGMRKRAALARALMQEPDFLVLDEPFQNLDASARQELWDLVFRVLADRGLGALVITHYPEELAGRPVRFWTWPTG